MVFILFVHSSLRFLNGFYLIFKYTSWGEFSELFLVAGGGDGGWVFAFCNDFWVLRRFLGFSAVSGFCGSFWLFAIISGFLRQFLFFAAVSLV